MTVYKIKIIKDYFNSTYNLFLLPSWIPIRDISKIRLQIKDCV